MKRITISIVVLTLTLLSAYNIQARFVGYGRGHGYGYGPYYGGYYGGGRSAAIATGALIGAGLVGSAIAADYDNGDYYDDGSY